MIHLSPANCDDGTPSSKSLTNAAEKLVISTIAYVVWYSLLEELFFALGVLGSILLERLVLNQAHIGTVSSASFRSEARTYGSIINVLVVASVNCLGPFHFRQIHFSSTLFIRSIFFD